MSNYEDHPDEIVPTQRDDRTDRFTRVARAERPQHATAAVEFAVFLIESAVADVKTWCRSQSQDDLPHATVSYGWLLGMPSRFTVQECCDHLWGLDHARILAAVHDIPRADELRPYLIKLLSELNDMTELIKRRPGESICIGGDTWVTVVNVKGRYVHLEIDAPLHVPVFKAEDDNRDASGPDF